MHSQDELVLSKQTLQLGVKSYNILWVKTERGQTKDYLLQN